MGVSTVFQVKSSCKKDSVFRRKTVKACGGSGAQSGVGPWQWQQEWPGLASLWCSQPVERRGRSARSLLGGADGGVIKSSLTQ